MMNQAEPSKEAFLGLHRKLYERRCCEENERVRDRRLLEMLREQGEALMRVLRPKRRRHV